MPDVSVDTVYNARRPPRWDSFPGRRPPKQREHTPSEMRALEKSRRDLSTGSPLGVCTAPTVEKISCLAWDAVGIWSSAVNERLDAYLVVPIVNCMLETKARGRGHHFLSVNFQQQLSHSREWLAHVVCGCYAFALFWVTACSAMVWSTLV